MTDNMDPVIPVVPPVDEGDISEERDADGYRRDEYGIRVDEQGNRVDEDGNPADADGDKIDPLDATDTGVVPPLPPRPNL